MVTYEIDPVEDLRRAEYEYAMCIGGWNRDTRRPQDDPEPVSIIKIRAVGISPEFFSHVDALGPHEGAEDVWYRLGALNPAQVETLFARLAASGLLEGIFGRVERTYRQGLLTSVQAGEAVATWIAAERDRLTRSDEDLPDGWARYQVAAPIIASIYNLLAPAGDTPSAAHLATKTTSVWGLAVWPEEDPGQVVVTRPEEFTQALEGLLRRGITFVPVPRPLLTAAVWRAGWHNVNALSRALGVDRKTVYADLRAQGIEPTDR
ncbi:hypothetical protein OG339_48715 (plasmid) [Streptosporangium sp. NBC_01495]|uniref:hypothetical protein n=1 Tax=Streptosporangium sp. NBC_01495 TaxID=2903899 RepID=UPI002E3814D2|nr:hypothetical protein [Streptosporangium sp. NBC_01495]